MDNSLYTAKTLVKERTNVLPAEITSLITDGALDVTMYNTENEFHLTNIQSTLLENEVVLVMLFFLDLEGFAERIAESLEIEPLTASKIASFIHEDLFYEIDDIFKLVYSQNKDIEAKIRKDELAELQNTLTPTTQAVPATEHTYVVEAEKEPPAIQQELIDQTAVQAMRTMEEDMSRVHGYGAYRAQFPDEAQETEHAEEVIRSASQEDILKEKPVLTNMPMYEEADEEK